MLIFIVVSSLKLVIYNLVIPLLFLCYSNQGIVLYWLPLAAYL